MKSLLKLSVFIVVMLFFIKCDKNNDSSIIIKSEVHGKAQKGPYIVGSSVTIFELDKNLAQSGKSFNTQITDNTGNFSMSNIELKTQFIEIKVDGFYFNEISGEKSSAPLTLYALSDVSDKTNINTNVISNLEKDRIRYLMTKKFSFSDSKNQAKSEILKIFNFSDKKQTNSELLDISKDGDENAMLLAISLILQGYGTVADLSELLADISNDIKEDGSLDNQKLGSKLMNNAKYLNLQAIRLKIEKRYSDIGIDAQISDFEKYIKLFLDSSDFKLTDYIWYPVKGNYGENILSDSITSFKPGKYSIAAYIPKGTTLKIIYTPISSNNWNAGTWIPPTGSWTIDTNIPMHHILTAEGNSTLIDNAYIELFNNKASYKFEFYEYGALKPTKTKIVTWNQIPRDSI